MTSPEHTLVGIHAAFAVGLSHRFGWTLIAIAGIASNIPDWDGLPMLIDMQRFESIHRVWGHNFVAILLSSILVAWTQTQFRWMESLGARFSKLLPQEAQISESKPVNEKRADENFTGEKPAVRFVPIFLTAVAVQIIHLPCDMVVSGGKGLSDWYIKPFWPFSEAGYVFPLIPWGDIGPTVILMGGAILLAKVPTRTPTISLITLASLCVYLVSRGWMRGMF